MSRDGEKIPKRAGRRIECLGPGKNVLVPDTNADEPAVDGESLEVIPADDKGLEVDLSRGFDPYDTGSFYKK